MPSARERAKTKSKELSSSRIWKMKVGTNCIRILPSPASKKGDDDLFAEFLAHSNVGADKKFLACGHTKDGKGKCFTCDKKIVELRKKGKDSRAAVLEPRPIMAVQIAVVDKKGNMTGPEMFWPAGSVQKGLVVKVFDNKKHDYTDPKKGRNLTYKRVGTGFKDTEYFGPDVDDDASKVPSEIMKKLVPIIDAKKDGKYLIPRYNEEDHKKAFGLMEDDSSSEAGSGSGSESSASSSASGSASESKKKSKKKSKSSSASGSSSEESGSASSSEESGSASGSSSGSASASSGSEDSSSEESGSESASSGESVSLNSSSEEESSKKKTAKKKKK